MTERFGKNLCTCHQGISSSTKLHSVTWRSSVIYVFTAARNTLFFKRLLSLFHPDHEFCICGGYYSSHFSGGDGHCPFFWGGGGGGRIESQQQILLRDFGVAFSERVRPLYSSNTAEFEFLSRCCWSLISFGILLTFRKIVMSSYSRSGSQKKLRRFPGCYAVSSTGKEVRTPSPLGPDNSRFSVEEPWLS